MLRKFQLALFCSISLLTIGDAAAQTDPRANERNQCHFYATEISFDRDVKANYEKRRYAGWEIRWDVCNDCPIETTVELQYHVTLFGFREDSSSFRRTLDFKRLRHTYGAASCKHEGTAILPENWERFLNSVSLDISSSKE